jgi:uncharacterized protein YkwD
MQMKSIAWSGSGCVIAALIALSGASAQDDRSALALDLVNEARQAEGLEPLTWAEALEAAAQVHADDMLDRDYFAHVSPEGATVRDRFLDEGGGAWLLVAENIANCRGCPTPPGPDRVREFQQGWMESPEHRAAILDPGLSEFGFAMSWGEAVVYGVQTFAGPGQSQGADETATSEELTKRALEAVNGAREAEGLEPLAASVALGEAAARLTEAGAVSDAEGALSEALDAVEGTWASVGMVAGECGGCGRRPTAADAAEFVSDWLDEPPLRQTLLDPLAESFGFTLSADGEGRKGAVGLTGQ